MALRVALRTLFKTPVVTSIAIVSLGFGIGANTAIFSLFNYVLRRPLPVPQPYELVNLGAPGPKPGSNSCGNEGTCDEIFSYPTFRDLEREQEVFTGIAAHVSFGASLAYGKENVASGGVLVSGSYFPVLGLTPAAGRLFSPADDATLGEPHAVVLSYEAWRKHYAENPGIIGQSMIVNGQSMTIIGVAPRGFAGTTIDSRPEVFAPLTMRGLLSPPFKDFDNRRAYWAYAFARLKPGVDIARAEVALQPKYHAIVNDVEAPLQTGMSDATMARFRSKLLTIVPGARGQSRLHQDAKAPITLLFAVAAVVLLIACANIANLLLARTAARSTEMAVRLSIGASRGRLIRQLLLESCLLGLMGGAAGLLIGRWTLSLIGAFLADGGPGIDTTTLDPWVLGFTTALSLGTGVLFGLFPAWHSTRPNLAVTLKNQAGQPSGARSAARFRSALVTAQVALSAVLLVAAGLFTRSLINVSRVDLGIDVDHIVGFSIAPRLNGYSIERTRDFFERTEDALAAMPGVSSVGASLVRMVGDDEYASNVTVEGFDVGPDANTDSFYNEVGPGFFTTLGMPLLAGREFTRTDTLGSPKVAIVNEAFTRKFRLGHDAVGKRFKRGRGDGPLDFEIVGVARDAAYSRVKDTAAPVFFMPYRQNDRRGELTFYLRTPGDPAAILAALPGVMARLDPNLPLAGVRTMAEQVRSNTSIDRVIGTLAAAFASLATLLAAIGLYGVLAYTVTLRTREFGLRMALGADPGRVRALVLRQVLWMTGVGLVIGIGAAAALGPYAESLLYRVAGFDPIVMIVAAIALVAVALVAGFAPAHRAARLDPMRALRYE